MEIKIGLKQYIKPPKYRPPRKSNKLYKSSLRKAINNAQFKITDEPTHKEIDEDTETLTKIITETWSKPKQKKIAISAKKMNLNKWKKEHLRIRDNIIIIISKNL